MPACRESGGDLAWIVFILLRFFYFLSVGWQAEVVVPAMRRLLLLLVAGSAGSTVSRGSSLALRTLPVRTASALPPHETEIDWRGGRKEKEGN